MSSSLKHSKDSKKCLSDLANHDFAEIKDTITFVDKTQFIKCVLSDTSKVVLLTAPRAFGKSTLMDMLKQFLLGKTRLFENLKICTEDPEFFSEHCRPHPVIHIDLANVSANSFANIKQKLAEAINATFRQHAYLVKKTDDGTLTWTSEKIIIAYRSVKHFECYFDEEKCRTLSEADLEDSLAYLSEVLHTHYEEKVWILIDEYDAPAVGLVFQPWSDKNDTELVGALLQNFMGATLKSNNYRERSLIFACVRLAGAISGDANRVIDHYPFLSDVRYAPYFGFTHAEVKQLLNLPEIKAACGEVSFQEIKEWYDGYMVSDASFAIFSSWSVLKVLDKALKSASLKYSSFWIDTGHIKNLSELFAKPTIQQRIMELISGCEITIRKFSSLELNNLKSLQELISLNCVEISAESVDLFLLFLADSGYFNMLSSGQKYQTKIKIPNFEINEYISKVCYSKALENTSTSNLNFACIGRYLSALKLVVETTTEKAFVDLANAILGLFSQSSESIHKESDLNSILYTLVYNSLHFKTLNQNQIGKKRKRPGVANTIDMLVMSKDVGIIFEYKVNSMSANDALNQIFAKQYNTLFDEPDYEHISKKVYVGLAFNTEMKEVCITYQVGTEGRKSVCSDTLL